MGAFDSLLADLSAEYGGRARAQDPSANDLRKTLSLGADGVDFDVHPSDMAVIKLFQRVISVVLSQSRRIADLEKAQGELSGSPRLTAGEPITKAAVANIRHASEAFMVKAIAAQAAGAVTGAQVAIAEAHINAGKAPPEPILRAVMASAA